MLSRVVVVFVEVGRGSKPSSRKRLSVEAPAGMIDLATLGSLPPETPKLAGSTPRGLVKYVSYFLRC